jgi:hypothetical protein
VVILKIFKLRRIIEEVITYFSVMFSTAVTSDVCSPTSEFRLTVLPFSTSVILVTDNVTKAAPGWYSDGTNKAYWDGNVVVNFRLALFYLLF